MESGLSTVATNQASGSLSSVGASLSNLGTTTKAFVIAHPTTAGFVMGVGTVFLLSRMLKKRRDKKALALQSA